MQSIFRFESTAKSTGLRAGIVKGRGVETPINFSAPPEFQGIAGVWSPEHFFTSAIATCFINTFQAIAAFSKFEAQGLEVSVEGEVEKGEGGYRFTRVTIRPILTIANEEHRERGLRLLEKSEKACLVSRSLQSQIILEPQVILSPTVAHV